MWSHYEWVNDPDVLQMILSSLPLAVYVLPSDATLLGADVNVEGVISSLLTNKLHELQHLSDRSKLLDTHDAFFLLKNCFALPRLMYTLRNNPGFDNAVVTRYDDLIRSTLQSILNVQLTDSSWKQAILPVRLGGLGIQIASRTALSTYSSSVCGSANLSTIFLPDRFAEFIGFNDARFLIYLDAWKSLSSSVPPDSQSMSRQRNWMSPLDEASHNEVLSAAHNQIDLARLIAVAAPYTGASLPAIPMSMIGSRLDALPSALQLPFDSVHRSVHHTSAFVGPPSKVPGCMVSAVGNQAVGLPDIQPSMGS